MSGEELVKVYATLIALISQKDLPDTEALVEKIGKELADAYDHSESLSQ